MFHDYKFSHKIDDCKIPGFEPDIDLSDCRMTADKGKRTEFGSLYIGRYRKDNPSIGTSETDTNMVGKFSKSRN